MSIFGLSHDAMLAIVLAIFLVFSLSVDFIFHKGDSFKSAVIWSVFWVACGIVVGGCVYLIYGTTGASEYFAGYALEKALSMDNLIVFMAIFSYFGIKDAHRQHTILLWGIAGAIIFRGIFVAIGGTLFNASSDITLFGHTITGESIHIGVSTLFGLVVAYSAVMMLKDNEAEGEEDDYDQKWFNKLAHKFFPAAGVMLFCGITIELSDVMFSFDSVPTVIAVTKEPMIVYAAMLSAILGLRALYFVIQSLVAKLHLLEKFVVAILFFVAAKLIAEPWGYTVSPLHSVEIVIGLLALGVIASLAIKPKH